MEDFIPAGGPEYWVLLGVLAFARGMDFLSTWVATPTLALEGNPLVKKMGWKWSICLNAVLGGVFATWPLPAVVISTTSVLVAARNFQQAWLMRSMGEAAYRDWMIARLHEAPLGLILFCLAGQAGLFGLVGGAIVYLSPADSWVPAIGFGLVGYALAVPFFSLLSLWRLRRF